MDTTKLFQEFSTKDAFRTTFILRILNIFSKMGVKNRTEATILAQKQCLIGQIV